jgi:hypothetical protein
MMLLMLATVMSSLRDFILNDQTQRNQKHSHLDGYFKTKDPRKSFQIREIRVLFTITQYRYKTSFLYSGYDAM